MPALSSRPSRLRFPFFRALPPALTGADFTVGELRKIGTVHLEVTCKPEVKEDFLNAAALLHSFFYEEARNRFQDIARRDQV